MGLQETGGFFCHLQLQGQTPHQTLQFCHPRQGGIGLAFLGEDRGIPFQKLRLPPGDEIRLELVVLTRSLALLTPVNTSRTTWALNSGVKLRWAVMFVIPPLGHSIPSHVGFLCVQDFGSTTNSFTNPRQFTP